MYESVLLSACLINVLFLSSLQVEGQVCYSGDLTKDDIQSLAMNCTTESCVQSNNQGFTFFFHHLTIPCNGILVSWTAAGELSLGQVDPNPTLLVWRSNPNDQNEYLVHYRTPLLNCNGELILPNSNRLYECRLQKRLPVRAGDVLGMEIPFYSSKYHRFNPFLDETSQNAPQVYFHRGTTIQNFVMSEGERQRYLPLFSVDIEQDDSQQDSSNSPDSTTVPDTQDDVTVMTTAVAMEESFIERLNVQLGFWEIIGIAGGALILMLSLLLIVIILCCVILRKTKTRRHETKKAQNEVDNQDVYSSEPYAVVNMRHMEFDAIHNPPSNKPRRKTDRIHITKNPSYAMNLSASPNGIREGRSLNSQEEDSRLGVSSRNREATTPTKESDERDYVSSPKRDRHSYQSVHRVTAVDDEAENYLCIEEMRRVDDIDSGIHLYHQPHSKDHNRTLTEEEDTSEHVYY